jgi:molybdopterin converting factor small subunit
MEVTVKFFSYCRILAGTDKLSTSLSKGATIDDLLENLRRILGKPDLGKDKTTFMVNQRQASLETALKDKDEIALLYLIGGG